MEAIDIIERAWDKITERKTVQEEIDEEFAPKSFREEWADTYQAIKRRWWIAASISIASTSMLFLEAFPNMFWLLAILIGLVLAYFYEKLKNYITKKGLILFYKKNNPIILPFAALLIVGSIVFSVVGTYCAYKALEGNTKKDVIQVTALERSAKVAEYDTLIIKAETAAEKFRTGALWKGSLGNNAKAYGEMAAKISDLQEEKRAALAKIDQQHSTTITEAVKDLGIYLYLLIAIALVVEAVIVAQNWFEKFYLYKVSKEDKVIYDDNEVISLPLKDISVFVKNAVEMAMNGGAAPGPSVNQVTKHTHLTPPIGFPIGTTGLLQQVPQAQQVPQVPPASTISTANTPTARQYDLEPRPCDHCGKVYKPRLAIQRFCQKACNRAFYKVKIT